MALYLGIDGGGSKTECAIASEQQILGCFTTASCKIQQVGHQQAAQNLHAAVRGALAEAKVDGRQIQQSCVGVSGISNPEVAEFIKTTLRSAVAGEINVVGDQIIAHEAAFQGGAGVLVIAGTGSIVYGRNQNGYMARAGGRGAEISDEGSGFWIGREAIATALAASDAGHDSRLLDQAMKQWKIAHRDQLKSMLSLNPPAPFAEFFPQVLAASRDGDASAREVLTRAGVELASLALHVICKLWPQDEDCPVRMAGSGGVLENSAEVRNSLRESVQKQRREVDYDERVVRPIEGALYLARKRTSSAEPSTRTASDTV